MTTPVLTTIRQQLDLLAEKAVTILMDEIDGKQVNGIHKIPVVLEMGKSV